jgi:hypothetical protein
VLSDNEIRQVLLARLYGGKANQRPGVGRIDPASGHYQQRR